MDFHLFVPSGKNILKSGTTVLTMLLAAGVAPAANLRFLKDAPASRFNAEDSKLFRAAFDKALTEAPDGTGVDWSNEKTGGRGRLTPVKTYEVKGASCRDLRIENSHSGRKAEGLYKFCRNRSGQWSFRE